MNRFKSEELDSPPPSITSFKEEDQPYLPKRPDRPWARKRKSQIAQLLLIHEDKDADDIRVMLDKKDRKDAMKKLKKPFKLQNMAKKDRKKDPLDMMGMIAPVNTGTYRGVRKSAYRKYNVHESPVVEHGLYPDRHTQEIDWILDKHDTSYKPNCFDTLPPYATQLARSTYNEPSPPTRLGRKRNLPVVPLPKVRKKQFSNTLPSFVDTSGKASSTMQDYDWSNVASSSRSSRSVSASSIVSPLGDISPRILSPPGKRFASLDSSSKASESLDLSSKASSSSLFEDYDSEDFEISDDFDLSKLF